MPTIVGTWKLVGARARDRDGKPLPEPYGGKGLGRVMFNSDGRMMAVTCDGRPDLPAGAERTYSSYIGRYTFTGDRLVTRVDGSSDPSRIGSDQVSKGSRDDSIQPFHHTPLVDPVPLCGGQSLDCPDK